MSEHEFAPAELKRSRAERLAGAVPLASGAAWSAAEIMHLAGHPGALWLGAGTALVTALSGWASAHGKMPAQTPAWAAAAGTWMAVSAAEGPLAGLPHPPLTFIGAVIAGVAWWKAQHAGAVTEAREWRALRAGWLEQARRWGLGGSHLDGFETTRLGERYEIDVRGTGKRASAFFGSGNGLAERIAEQENLPVSRVRIVRHPLAGRIIISIRRIDPWAKPILHPVIDAESKVDLSGPYSIRTPAQVGQDPETGRPLTVPFWDERGGKVINFVAQKGSGKTVLLNCGSERITIAPDALMIRINLSVKGPAEAKRWGVACHLTAFGPQQKSRAVAVLKVVSGIIEWRARQDYPTDVFIPSAADPLIIVIFDEADSAMAVGDVRKLADNIATKGREYGVTLVRAGQRGTTDYGSAKTRSQDDVIGVGNVNRSQEVYHAAGNMGLALPDMATYGEGHSGVWAIGETGTAAQIGRTFLLKDPGDVAKIAQDRAFTQPELPAACREFLGDAYEVLLAEDCFARWAREQDENSFDTANLSPADGKEPAAGDGGTASAPLPAAAPVVTATADPVTDTDFFSQHDWEPEMDEETRAKLAAVDRKLGGVRAMNAGTAALPKPPEVSKEALAASTAERWRRVGEQAEISEIHMSVLLGLLASGTTISIAAETLGVSKWTARTYLEALRNKKVARVEGVKRAARWVLTESAQP